MSDDRKCITGNGAACLFVAAGLAFLFVDETYFLSLGFFALGTATWGMFGSSVIVRSVLGDRKRGDDQFRGKVNPVELRKWRKKHPILSLPEAIKGFLKEQDGR